MQMRCRGIYGPVLAATVNMKGAHPTVRRERLSELVFKTPVICYNFLSAELYLLVYYFRSGTLSLVGP